MEYNNLQGAWLDTETVEDGQKVKLINECVAQTSKFKDDEGNPKTENVVKARFQGMEETVNMRLNWTTVYALIEAFGKESKNWIGHTLVAKPKDATTGISVYLVPEGFEMVRNEKKRWEIRKVEKIAPPDIIARTRSTEEIEENINADDDTENGATGIPW